MKILVIGSGGREHALVWALRRTSTRELRIFCAPGNAGIAELAECVPIAATDVETLANFVQREWIDLTMVGPEGPLAAGVVDEFTQRGLRIVGPGREAARLEASKIFAKDFMRRHGIPTARYRVASTRDEAITILASGEFGDGKTPVVLKADGLAAGKGVVVALSRSEAELAIDDLRRITPGTPQLVIEEALSGREVSLLLFSDGKDYRLMPAARDHKRVGDNDTGPNTGGMGSITDPSLLDDTMLRTIVGEIVEPTLRGARDEGFPFRGILFIGLMLTDSGPQVLEYNVRFGDPETQAILVRLETDLSTVFEAVVDKRLGKIDLKWSSQSSACVVLAAAGYPAKPETGAQIEGLESAANRDRVAIFHAATTRGPAGEWFTAGGRVLGVTATGSNLESALDRAYASVGEIHWKGMHYRRDIGREFGPKAAACE